MSISSPNEWPCTNGSAVSSPTVTINPSAGATVLLFVAARSSAAPAPTVSSVTDGVNPSGAWSKVAGSDVTSPNGVMGGSTWIANNVAGQSTVVTIHLSGPGTVLAFAREVDGSDVTAAVDKVGINDGGVAAVTASTAAQANSGDLAVSGVFWQGGSTSDTMDSTWTNGTAQQSTSSGQQAVNGHTGTKAISDASAVSLADTLTPSAQPWIATIVTVKAGASAPPPPPPVSGMLYGCLDRKGMPRTASYDPPSVLGGYVLNVDWSTLQPANGGPVSSSAIDHAVSLGLPFKVRVFANGDPANQGSCPPWLYSLVGHYDEYEPQSRTTRGVAIWWDPRFSSAYADLQTKMAARWDGLILDNAFAACTTYYSEPFLFGGSSSVTRTNMLAAANPYTDAKRAAAMTAGINAHKVWKQTATSLACNPANSITSSGGFTLDETYTESVMDAFVAAIGSGLAVLGNNSLGNGSGGSTGLTGQYGQMITKARNMTAAGQCRFYIQTCSYSQLQSPWTEQSAVETAISWGASYVELASGYDTDLATTQVAQYTAECQANLPASGAHALTVNVAPTTAPVAGTTWSSQLGTFTDTNTQGVATDYTATVYWGDGTTAYAGTITRTSAGVFSVSGTHTYAAAGTYTLKITAAHTASGATRTAQTTVTVGSSGGGGTRTITVHVQPDSSAAPGVTWQGQVGSFTDSDTTTHPASDYTASIAWGDSSSSAGTITSLGGGNFAVTGTHNYAAAGSDTITLTITHTPSSTTGNATGTMTVVAPVHTLTVTVAPASNATAGLAWTGQLATFTDSIIGDAAGNYNATVTWGDSSPDGVAVVSLVDASAGLYAVSTDTVGHAWPLSGSYTVTVHVTHVSGSSASGSGVQTVVDQPAPPPPPVTGSSGTRTTSPVVSVIKSKPDLGVDVAQLMRRVTLLELGGQPALADLAHQEYQAVVSVPAGSGWVEVANSRTNAFRLVRPMRVQLMAALNITAAGASNLTADIEANIWPDGPNYLAQQYTSSTLSVAGGATMIPVMVHGIVTLPAGTYNLSFEVRADSGLTVTVQNLYLDLQQTAS